MTLEFVSLNFSFQHYPFIAVMSADCDVNVAKRGLEHGACYYLMKPVSIGELRNIWQHLIRKKIEEKKIGQIGSSEKVEEDTTGKKSSEDGESASTVNEGNSKKQLKRQKETKEDGNVSDDEEENTTQRKPRITWHSSLHAQFLNAVDKIGIDSKIN